jgi:hypothetical protein
VGLLYKYKQNKKKEHEKRVEKKARQDREVARKRAALEEKERQKNIIHASLGEQEGREALPQDALKILKEKEIREKNF